MNINYVEDRWPDEEARATRKDALIARLDAFFGEFREGDFQSGSWPDVPEGDIIALWEIFGEIVDLKFGRDCDGARAIQFDVSFRRNHRLHSFYEPQTPDTSVTDAEWNEYVGAQLRAISGMSSQAGRMASILESETRCREEARARAAAYEAAIAAFGEFIKTAEFPEGRAEYERLAALYPNSRELFPNYANRYIKSGAIVGRTELLEEIASADIEALVVLRPRVVALVNEYGKALTAKVWRDYNARLEATMIEAGRHHHLDTRLISPARTGKTD